MRVATWNSATLLLYVALLTLTPTRYLGSYGLTLDRIVLIVGVSGTLIFLVLQSLRSTSPLSVSLYTLALLAPVLGLFLAGSLSLLVEGNEVLDLSTSWKDLITEVFIVVLSIYLANRASVSGSPAALLGKVVLILVAASGLGAILTLAGLTPLDVLNATGLTPASQPTTAAGDLLLDTYVVRYFGLPRAQGFFLHSIEYGATLTLAYAVVRSRKDVLQNRYLRWSACACLVAGIVLSGTRGAWLGVILIELMLLYTTFKTRGRFLVVIASTCVVIFALFFVSPTVISSYSNEVRASTSDTEASIALRLADYKPVFSALRDHPFGVGYANWADYAQSQGYGYDVATLDNDYLRFLAEGGVLGLLAYLLYVFRGLFPISYARSKHDRSTVYIVTAAYALMAATFDSFAFLAYTVVYAVLLTIALRVKRVVT
jgi:O-antigen ligase